MAGIDVSELLLDPDFIDQMQVVHRIASVNSYGETTIAETTVQAVGCIQAASGQAIQRLPEALRQGNVRAFFIKAPILADGSTQYPDILVFRGQRYQVQTLDDWLNYGAGWNKGLAIQEKPSS